MPTYLPLCAFRQDLLPETCRSCAWWLSSGLPPADAEQARAIRKQWMSSVEAAWGSTGLLYPAEPRPFNTGDNLSTVASIHYAPVTSVPRLRDLPLGPLPTNAVLVFCLRAQGPTNQALTRRLLQKALFQLRQRGVREVYAYAAPEGGADDNARCQYFAPDLLERCGFRQVRNSTDLILMKVDLGGLAALLSQIENTLRRLVGQDPHPSPATWSRRGAT